MEVDSTSSKVETSMKGKLKLVSKYFSIYMVVLLVVSLLGAYFLPVTLLVPVAIIASLTLFVMMIGYLFLNFMKKGNKESDALPWGILSGIAMGLIVSAIVKMIYVKLEDVSLTLLTLGVGVVLLITITLFVITMLIGFKVKRSLEGWYTPLSIALLGLILVSVVCIFTKVDPIVYIIISVLSLVIFLLFNIVDCNTLKHNDLNENTASWLALGLFYNFVNIFIDLIQLLLEFILSLIGGFFENL